MNWFSWLSTLKCWYIKRQIPRYQAEFMILHDKHLIQSFLAQCPLAILDSLHCSPERHPLHYQAYKMRIMEVYGIHPLTVFEEVSYVDLSNYVKENHGIRPIPLPHLLHFLGPTENTNNPDTMKTIFVRMLERPFLESATFFHHKGMERYAEIWLSLVMDKYDHLSSRAKKYIQCELPYLFKIKNEALQLSTVKLVYRVIAEQIWDQNGWYVAFLEQIFGLPIARLLHNCPLDIDDYYNHRENNTHQECDIIV